MIRSLALAVSLLAASPALAETPAGCDLKAMRWTGMPFDASGKEIAACRPQILYSWLAEATELDPKDALWPFRRGRAFLFRTALGSAGYGSFSYRVKLKPSVKFKLEEWTEAHALCSHPEAEKKNTVYIAHEPKATGFSEYVICSPDVVESWSFGMPQHFDEILRERALVKRLGAENVDGFLSPAKLKRKSVPAALYCEECFFKTRIHDARHKLTVENLNDILALMKTWVDGKKGKVYVMADRKAYTSGPPVDRHFQTRLTLPFQRKTAVEDTFEAIRLESVRVDGKALEKPPAFCDGKSDCEYKIARKFVGGEGPIGSFDVRWACRSPYTGRTATKRYQVKFKRANLEGHVFNLGCSAGGVGSVVDAGKKSTIGEFKAIAPAPKK